MGKFSSKTAMYIFVSLLVLGNYIFLPYVVKEEPSNFATALIILCIILMIAKVSQEKKDNN